MASKARYVNISIPEKLAHYIDKWRKENEYLDLRSRAQVVNFALRKLFTEKDK
ncbi:MAG TPA: hypothetical protein VJB89_01230 [Candidatus Nanoarchaeia archaeon]|nr:hypothetical protein [Candidatus Nanoarchaeia archaeon]